MSFFKRYRELFLVLVLLGYPATNFFAKNQSVRDPSFVDKTLLTLTSYPEAGILWGIDRVKAGFHGYLALRGVKLENDSLRTENSHLRAEVNAREEARLENDRLRRLLDFANARDGHEIAARVLGVNPVSTLLSVRINRGEDQGVTHGMPVVTPDGVVGQVVRAWPNFADVALITDTNSKLGVRVQRTRARATAAGAGGKRNLKLDYALRTEDIRDEDAIVTSGTDDVFPPGLAVGKVTGLKKQSYGMFQTAEIVPAVDVTRLEEVLVLPINVAGGSEQPPVGVPAGATATGASSGVTR